MSNTNISRWRQLYDAGMIGLEEAMVMTLVAIRQSPESENYLELVGGDVAEELKELVNGKRKAEPDEEVLSWLQGMSPPERLGLKRLIESIPTSLDKKG